MTTMMMQDGILTIENLVDTGFRTENGEIIGENAMANPG